MTARWRHALFSLAAICAASAQASTIEECLRGQQSSAVDACEKAAQAAIGDRYAVAELAARLESLGRHAAAQAVYEQGLVAHPNSRILLKGRLRARRLAKATALIANHPVDAGSEGMPAAHATQIHSEGPVETVRESLPPAPIVDPVPAAVATVASESGAALVRVPDGPAPQAPLSTAAKLELLADLRRRGLIDDDELRLRRDRILGAVLDEPRAAKVDPPVTAGRYRALVIGNERYEDFVHLQTPRADARSVAAVLRNRYGFETQTLFDATRYDILKALSELRRDVTAEDNLLVYYAGHGFLDEATRRGYWLPVDAERDNYANWISTHDVTDALAAVAARHAIVVADSCFSGSLLRNAHAETPEQRDALLARLAEKRSRTVLTSGGLEPVLDDGDGRHSIFARVFLDVLKENQGVLEAGRLFLTVRDRVSRNADQTPQYAPLRNAGHEGGDFIFVRQR